MDLRNIIKEIDKGSPRAVYVCYGPEKFRMQEFIAYLLEACIEPGQQDLAVSRYDLSETPLDGVLDDAETMPFLVRRKVILASGAGFLTAARDSGKVEHRTDRLLTYMKAPADFSVIIFTVDADKLDERKKLVKTLKDSGSLLPFPALTPEELTHWVVRRAQQIKLTFDNGAVEQFILYTGTSLQALASELEKLSLYVGEGGIVTAEIIDQMVVRTTEQNVFLLTEEIVQLRKDKALAILYELVKQREEPIKILMLMARQFRIMLQVKELEKQGYSQQQIAGRIGAHPYTVKLAAGQAKRYSFTQLTAILSRLAELDYEMKSGRTDKVFGLELFILGLAV